MRRSAIVNETRVHFRSESNKAEQYPIRSPESYELSTGVKCYSLHLLAVPIEYHAELRETDHIQTS